MEKGEESFLLCGRYELRRMENGMTNSFFPLSSRFPTLYFQFSPDFQIRFSYFTFFFFFANISTYIKCEKYNLHDFVVIYKILSWI